MKRKYVNFADSLRTAEIYLHPVWIYVFGSVNPHAACAPSESKAVSIDHRQWWMPCRVGTGRDCHATIRCVRHVYLLHLSRSDEDHGRARVRKTTRIGHRERHRERTRRRKRLRHRNPAASCPIAKIPGVASNRTLGVAAAGARKRECRTDRPHRAGRYHHTCNRRCIDIDRHGSNTGAALIISYEQRDRICP